MERFVPIWVDLFRLDSAYVVLCVDRTEDVSARMWFGLVHDDDVGSCGTAVSHD